MIAQLIADFGFDAKVFFKGDFCGTTHFDGQDGGGHLHFIREGTVIMEHAAGPLVVDGPAVVLYPKPFPHRLVVAPGADAKLVCATIHFRDTERNPFVAAMPAWVHMPVNDVSGLVLTTQHLFLEATRNEPGQHYVMDRLCDILVFEIIRHVFKQDNLKTGTLAGFSDPGIARALAAIHANPGAAWNLATLASEASMSRSKFALRFHELVGITPARYLSDWRLSVAMKLLQQDHSVKAVAAAVGYGTQPSFTKAFVNSTGLSPKQWLLRQREMQADGVDRLP